MEIYSLSGSSGTGKSTSALAFAHQKMIPAIIDDGLLIVNGQKVAGTSAKFEKYALAAVKRATFSDEKHRLEVQQALKNFFVGKLLIIGTSDRMTRLIAERLDLGKIQHYYYIEDIRTSSEIKLAQYVRKMEGKHIIPIPYKQVEQNFFKKLIQRGRDIFSNKKERIGETTIVFPDFHRDHIHIEKKVFSDIVEYTCKQYSFITHCEAIKTHLDQEPMISVSIGVRYPVCDQLNHKLANLQQDLYEQFLALVHLEISEIRIYVTSITISKKKEPAYVGS